MKRDTFLPGDPSLLQLREQKCRQTRAGTPVRYTRAVHREVQGGWYTYPGRHGGYILGYMPPYHAQEGHIHQEDLPPNHPFHCWSVIPSLLKPLLVRKPQNVRNAQKTLEWSTNYGLSAVLTKSVKQ